MSNLPHPNSPPFALDILYQDQHVVILNKPAGIPVHTGPAGGVSVEACFAFLSRRKDGPWLAHRLDTETSGCLAIALRKQPLIAMQQAFAAKTVHKTYWAVVQGGPDNAQGDITLPLRKHSTKAEGWSIKPDPKGEPARTTWRVLGHSKSKNLTWLELTLHTGRTHQARVHCAAMGWPIMGDTLYGKAHPQGLHLLARSLTLPFTPPLHTIAPPRHGMQAALKACGWQNKTE
ncbi:RluA family pseudouridine synthase [Acetobacter orientalis]|uniref:RluA family pseudouridine synthase n=1 Tax=Acetobacter orientalis TaxID=146474 RepID=UPI0020A0F74E|nr:RluA family pseudouridine synthase [Acetobacter orientalis]MCP1215399.1 RluA family pseudouridine synthase [Acetobacter orientalis]MCP1218982.1 RluA family pseudouridine synthase [Acetobacter orientalis]